MSTLTNVKVLCVGAVCVDIVASVDSFPKPDAKIKTNNLIYTHGGNSGNTATAVQRLGLQSSVLTKIGMFCFIVFVLDVCFDFDS